ncbi:MAG TPA: DUF3850 domain-containing protein [Nevskia sp.]|nr:DUF3850 domain-containing protein [Nevskia sp.]
MSKIHKVKIWPAPFRDVVERRKSFEVRKNDRDYQPGDVLWLEEFNPQSAELTGRSQLVDIDYVLRAGEYGLPGIEQGFAVLGISL